MYVCVCVCMYVCMDGWMHACMHACMYVWSRVPCSRERELGGPYHWGGAQGSGVRTHIWGITFSKNGGMECCHHLPDFAQGSKHLGAALAPAEESRASLSMTLNSSSISAAVAPRKKALGMEMTVVFG